MTEEEKAELVTLRIKLNITRYLIEELKKELAEK
jgi:hypothetical protein